MKPPILTVLSLILALSLQSAICQSDKVMDDRSVMVQVKAEYAEAFRTNGESMVSELMAKYKAINAIQAVSPLHPSGTSPVYLLRWEHPQPIKTLVAALKQTGRFEIVEPNYIGRAGGQEMVGPPNTPNDRAFDQQWSLRNDGSFDLSRAIVGADIDMTNAWTIETGSTAIVVAVLDTGDPIGHPELTNRLWTNETDINGIDDDGNGYIDDTRGYDFINDDPWPSDQHGHGSNVAGIIVAEANNNLGLAGVDWNCKLMSLQVLDDSGFGLYSTWTEAIYYAADNGAHIINMSLGGNSSSQLMQNAIDYATDRGVLVVACMMNDNTSQPRYPAALDNVLSVGSTDPDDTRSRPFFWSPTSGSNWGSHIDLVAPGNYIYGLNSRRYLDYTSYWGGTSQAAPHVAGVASLLLAQDITRTPAELRELITSTADDQVGGTEDQPGYDLFYGHGRLNAYKALVAGADLISAIEEEEAVPFTIAPNPIHAGSSLLIETQEEAYYNVFLYDISGQVVKRAAFDGIAGRLGTSDLSAGIYVVQLTSGDGTSITKKLLVR